MGKLVSVVIPTFDRKKSTDIAVESVITQYPDLVEIIVVDDFGLVPYDFADLSNSNSVDVRVIRLTCNGGPGMARMAGVENANGTYVAFLDSDDSYDPAWLDCVISLLENYAEKYQRIALSGIVNGERPVGGLLRKLLAAMPKKLQLTMSRVAVMIFNPFYMQSVVIHKESCRFLNSLRYCEDYYTVGVAMFLVDNVFLPNIVACHLGREPNTAGGLSNASDAMHEGEMRVRRTMLGLEYVPLRYKMFLPLGMLYQKARILLKKMIVRL